jgi:hypothetical protein
LSRHRSDTAHAFAASGGFEIFADVEGTDVYSAAAEVRQRRISNFPPRSSARL